MSDYIKRKEALRAAAEDSGIYLAINCIPAADVVERKKGEWAAEIPSSPSAGYLKLRCSECNAEYTFIGGTSFFFCPNCGSDMRKGGDT